MLVGSSEFLSKLRLAAESFILAALLEVKLEILWDSCVHWRYVIMTHYGVSAKVWPSHLSNGTHAG